MQKLLLLLCSLLSYQGPLLAQRPGSQTKASEHTSIASQAPDPLAPIVQFESPTPQSSNRIAVDSLSSIPFQTSITQAACQPVDHVITTQITNSSFITVAQVMYSVDGGFFQGINLQPLANQFTATIPAQTAGVPVTWYIRTVGMYNYQTPSASYVDGSLAPKMRTQVGSSGSTIQISSRVATTDTSMINFGGQQPAHGVFVQVRSQKHLEINNLLIGLNDTCSIEIYEAKLPELRGVITVSSFVKIASVSDAVPIAGGFTAIPLSKPIQMAAENVRVLYILADTPTGLRVSPLPYAQQLIDSNFYFLSAWRSLQPFSFNFNLLAWPVMKVPIQSPIDSLQWFLPSAPNVPISTANTLSVTVDNQPTAYGLRFFRDSCVHSETFLAQIGHIDWGMEEIISPTQWNEVQADPVATKVALRNSSSIAARPPAMELLTNGQVRSTFMWPQTIPAGDSIWINFPPINLQAQFPGIEMCAVALGDQNPANDTSCRFIPAPNSLPVNSINSLELYPNPAKDWVKMRWEQSLPQAGIATIMDVNGRVLLRESLPAGSVELQFSIASLPAGWYLVQLRSGPLLGQCRLVIVP